MARRQHLTLTVVLVLVGLFTLSYMFSGPADSISHLENQRHEEAPLKENAAGSKSEFSLDIGSMPSGILEGESIAPKLENATLK